MMSLDVNRIRNFVAIPRNLKNAPPQAVPEGPDAVFQANNDVEERFKEHRSQDRHPERIDDNRVNELHEEVQHDDIDEHVGRP